LTTLLTFLLSATTLCAATLRFEWAANPEPDVVGYRLYYGPASRTYTNAVTLGTVTSHTMVVDGKQYFALTAFNSAGIESALSRELWYDPLTPVSFTGHALWLVVDRSTDGTLWEPAITNDVAPVWPSEMFRLRLERGALKHRSENE